METSYAQTLDTALNYVVTYTRKVEEATYLKDLVISDLVTKLRTSDNVWNMLVYELNNAFYDQPQKTSAWKLVKKYIEQEFFKNNPINLRSITQCGLDNHSYCFDIEYNGFYLYVYVPNCKNITVKNIEFANYGKYRIFCSSLPDGFESYDANKITDKIAEIVKE